MGPPFSRGRQWELLPDPEKILHKYVPEFSGKSPENISEVIIVRGWYIMLLRGYTTQWPIRGRRAPPCMYNAEEINTVISLM